MVTPAGERYTQQYDADSRRTTLLLGLGSKRKYQYDSAGRLTTQVELNASNQGIYTMVDSYDAVGNRAKRVANGNPTTWLYDDAYRLIGQQKSGQAATFVYDANSNLTTKWHQGGDPRTMVYDAADRLTTMQVGGTTTTFQWGLRMARQYQTGSPVATYSYTDINNNLRVAQDAAGLTTSTYDGDNLRRRVVSSSVTTTMVWDGSDYLQIKPSSGDSTLLVVLEGEVIGHVKGSEKRDYIVDPLGSVVAYLNSSQTLTDQFEYWPYGEAASRIEDDVEPFLWVGSLGYFRENDLRTYIRAREYRPDLGSWMQLDPLWPNERAFAYVDGSPVLRIDPSGRNPVCIGCGICLGATALGTLLSCAGAEDHMECILCRFATNPGLRLLVAGCVTACAVCLGAWIVNILPKPAPVPVFGFAGASPAGKDPCKGRKKQWTCSAKCTVRGPTPPCGYFLFGSGSAKTQHDACTAAKRDAIHTVNSEHMRCCTVGHCQCPTCTRN
jgi:RHS repeat-associated protein